MSKKKNTDNKKNVTQTVVEEVVTVEKSAMEEVINKDKIEEVLEPITTPEEILKKPLITIPPPKIVKNMNELVSVTPKFTGERFIAGNWYRFTKDKEIKVPIHVKELMLKNRTIYS